MDTTNPILGNPLLIAAILLLLAILPRALRQNKKTALDKAVERFEKEELKAASEENPDENENRQKKPIALKDGSLAYLKKDLPTPQKTGEPGGFPPFPTQEDEKVKIVKPGVPISHFETADPPAKKKIKLIKQEFSIAPDPNKVSSKKVFSDPKKDKQSKSPTDDQKSSLSEDFPAPPPISDSEEPKDSWIEAEIPGLTIEPPPEEKTGDIPIFNAFPKEKYRSEAEKPQESPSKEKQGMDVKNIAPKTEEEKDLKPEKQVTIETDSPKLKVEISESEPKEVEIKGSVPSHKNIAKKESETQKADAPPSKAGKAEKTEAEVTAASPQQDDIKTSPETAKLKPFLLDLRYLDQEELEAENPVSHEKLSADMADVTIARLNALQVDLENQLGSIPGELAPRRIPIDKHMRKDRIQDSLPDLEGTINGLSDKKEVSLEELDSFLFTATQRKSKE
jgi:hypothetical protein